MHASVLQIRCFDNWDGTGRYLSRYKSTPLNFLMLHHICSILSLKISCLICSSSGTSPLLPETRCYGFVWYSFLRQKLTPYPMMHFGPKQNALWDTYKWSTMHLKYIFKWCPHETNNRLHYSLFNTIFNKYFTQKIPLYKFHHIINISL